MFFVWTRTFIAKRLVTGSGEEGALLVSDLDALHVRIGFAIRGIGTALVDRRTCVAGVEGPGPDKAGFPQRVQAKRSGWALALLDWQVPMEGARLMREERRRRGWWRE